MIDAAARMAYADESFHEAPEGGFYVLAAAVFDARVHNSVRVTMRELRGKRKTAKLHWREMDVRQRSHAAATVAAVDGFHVVTIGTPVPRSRQERARAKCLNRLVIELHSRAVTELVIESRTQALNARDVATVRGARYCLPDGARFHVDHLPGHDEPLLWAADVVAGAVRAHRQGEERFRQMLESRLHEIELDTHE